MILDPTIGDEIKKKRPVVILNAGHRKNLKLAIVLPITGWKPYLDENPFFVTICMKAFRSPDSELRSRFIFSLFHWRVKEMVDRKCD